MSTTAMPIPDKLPPMTKELSAPSKMPNLPLQPVNDQIPFPFCVACASSRLSLVGYPSIGYRLFCPANHLQRRAFNPREAASNFKKLQLTTPNDSQRDLTAPISEKFLCRLRFFGGQKALQKSSHDKAKQVRTTQNKVTPLNFFFPPRALHMRKEAFSLRYGNAA